MIPPHLPKRMLPLMKLERVTKVRGKGHPLLCYLCPCYVRCLGCYAAKREPTSWASGLDSEQNSKKWVGYGQYIQQLASQCLKANINASASFFFTSEWFSWQVLNFLEKKVTGWSIPCVSAWRCTAPAVACIEKLADMQPIKQIHFYFALSNSVR